MKKQENLRHRMLEVTEGGLQGSRGARIFSWAALVLIMLSNSFFLLTKIGEPGHRLAEVFEIVEILTIALFTAEIVLEAWMADLLFPEARHPLLRFLRRPMTVIGILAILPFYMGLILRGTRLEPIAEIMEFMTLLHLVKAWELLGGSGKEEP